MSPSAQPLRAIVAITAGLGLCLLFSSCYVTSQGLRYISILSKAVSIDRALADPKTKPDLRLLLERARAARAFALANFGLKKTKNYGSVVVLDADRLATVVQACAELSFTRYLWSYPVVGKMPYRGYFDPKDAEKEAALLKNRGLDVIARPVDAFSTLGWFSDPLFSFMSGYGEADITDLIMHEMTHATIFLKGDHPGAEQFNEELAVFVGGEGSLIYLASKYGADSPEIAAARADRADEAAFSAYLAGTGKELEAVYASGASDDEKRKRKAEIIAARADEYKKEYASLFKGNSYKNFHMERINNAYIDLYRLYEGETSLYRDFYEKRCSGDMRLFIETVARIAKTKSDPKAEMRRLIGDAGSRA
ncbi:MAG: aminopeptidase [Rectinemataceae bacterium]|jgi:predicted aminopeptidase